MSSMRDQLTGFEIGELVELAVEDASGNTDQLLLQTWGQAPVAISADAPGLPTEMESRVNRIVPPVGDIASVEIVTHPSFGRLTKNDDMTLSWNLSYERAAGFVDLIEYTYTTNVDPTPVLVTLTPTISQTEQLAGWPSGRAYYFEIDSDLYSKVEPGLMHRKVHISPNGFDVALLASSHGVSEGAIDGDWLAQTLVAGALGGDGTLLYGETPATALDVTLGRLLWRELNFEGGPDTSNWLLLERGHSYNSNGIAFADGTQGESPMHPTLIGSYGTGPKPVVANTVQADASYGLSRGARNLVVRELAFAGAGKVELKGGNANLAGGNFLVEDILDVGGKEMQVADGSGMCMRFAQLIRQIDTDPADVTHWDPSNDRISSFFTDEATDFFFEGCNAYHAGWGEGYDFNLSAAFPQAPSAKSHGWYIQKRCFGLVMRNCMGLMAAGGGLQARGGGILIDNLWADSNQLAYTSGGVADAIQPEVNTGGWSYWFGNVGTSAGHRDAAEGAGSLARGLACQRSRYNTSMRNIVCHKADPDNQTEVAAKTTLSRAHGSGSVPAFFDTKVFNWEDADGVSEANIDGLDPAILMQTTLQRYAGAHSGFSGTTITDWAEYYTTLDTPLAQLSEQTDVINYFRSAFGIPQINARTTPSTLLFTANFLGDGIHWMTPFNWNTNDTPIDGDSVDLRCCWTTFACLTVELADLTLGSQGRVTVVNGRLGVTGGITAGPEGGLIEIDYIGRFICNGCTTSDPMDIAVLGGRFVNNGTFAANANFNLSGGQTVLADSGASFTLMPGNTMSLTGAALKVGFDSVDGGAATLVFSAGSTLSFAAKHGALATIGAFHSGRHGPPTVGGVNGPDTLNVAPEVVLGGTLELDITGLSAGEYVLIEAAQITGAFDTVAIVDSTMSSGQNPTQIRQTTTQLILDVL